MVRAEINFSVLRLSRDFQDLCVNIVQKSFVELMYLYTCGDVSVEKGRKLIEYEGMLKISGFLLLLEYPELIENQKDSQCLNSSNKK